MTREGRDDRAAAAAPTAGELRAFVAVAEERHFRRAARRLGVAPPRLSQTVRRLEEKLGAELFERTPRAVTPTAAGAALLPRARDILDRMTDASLAVRGTTGGRSGRFTVGVYSNGFAELTGPIISAFREANPRARVALADVSQDPGEALLSGAVDVALVRPPIPGGSDRRLRSETLVLERRAAIISRRHPMAGATEISIADLHDDPFVAVAPTVTEIRDFWAAADAHDGQPPRLDAEAWTVPEVLMAVGHLDNVITSFPSLLRFFRVPGVVAVPLVDVPPAPMDVVTRADDARPLVASFLEAARAVSAQLIDLVPEARLAPT